MKGRLGVQWVPAIAIVVGLLVAPAARAQDDAEASPGVTSGDYKIHQMIEFGYRSSNINGNQDTYNTFEDLGSGVRLFDFNFQMRSIDHRGFFFDTLDFSNFGYGGDPNDVSRLRI